MYLSKSRATNAQIAKWAVLLLDYEISYRHRPGERMHHADALSRISNSCHEDMLVDEEVVDCAIIFFTVSEINRIAAFQSLDERVKQIKTALIEYDRDRTRPDPSVIDFNDLGRFTLDDDILYRLPEDGSIVKHFVILTSIRKALCIQFHENFDHYSAGKVHQRLSERYWFPLMRRYVRQHVRRCISCITEKPPTRRITGKPVEPDRRSFRTIHMDHDGLFIRSMQNHQYVLMIEDNLSRYVQYYAVPDVTTHSTLNCLRDYVLRFGTPKRIISDIGVAFSLYAFRAYCEQQGIDHHIISVRHPQSYGLSERMNKVIHPQMSMYCEREDKRD